MTELLQKAFAEASRLPSDEQDALAIRILQELESEQKWEAAFANSIDALEKLADEALDEHRRGHTQPLDPDSSCNLV